MKVFHPHIDELVMSSSSKFYKKLDLLETPFRQFKEYLGSLYKKLPKIQSYQILSMSRAKPGEVSCRRMTAVDPKWVKLGRKRDESVPITFVELWEVIPYQDEPPLNSQKVYDINEKILKYVPNEYKSDPIYEIPTAESEEEAQLIKKARRETATQRKRQKQADTMPVSEEREDKQASV
ncbi:hypothetical protein BBJ28_00018327 [Nothophytophthora sp. Chile5]|nr:hypothetical protein BBJ28_00018327 [Nothophytophthora sp. Chile5]